jgi:hypothetical protein
MPPPLGSTFNRLALLQVLAAGDKPPIPVTNQTAVFHAVNDFDEQSKVVGILSAAFGVFPCAFRQ